MTPRWSKVGSLIFRMFFGTSQRSATWIVAPSLNLLRVRIGEIMKMSNAVFHQFDFTRRSGKSNAENSLKKKDNSFYILGSIELFSPLEGK
jgi:hypothetical protein